MVDLEESNLQEFVKAVKGLNFKPKIPVPLEDFTDKGKRESWVKEKGMMVFSLFDPRNPYFLLDVFVIEPFDFNKEYKAKREMKSGKVKIPLISLDHLVKMKEKAGRPQDISDVFYLKKIEGEWQNEK
ncbi:MAG: hypothetical protein MRK02_04635 [Candidatus Scalindua sp.]|nr:hypothetical protein [Candidatus Scalindua sp.]